MQIHSHWYSMHRETKDKVKFDMDEGSLGSCCLGSSNSMGHDIDACNTGTLPSLTPWERTVASDGGLFHMQYMDLGEFLTENGMAMHGAQMPSQSSQCPSTSPSAYSSCSSSSVSAASPNALLGLDMLGVTKCTQSPPQVCHEPASSPDCQAHTVSPMNDDGDLLTTFDSDPADVALSSIPGQKPFDPQTHFFSEEELKLQPVIKKARKMQVPDNLKDEKYWNRRVKNNEAAKRSRDARRLKENQISVRASFLERENAALRQEVANMRKELGRCRSILSKYESHYDEQL